MSVSAGIVCGNCDRLNPVKSLNCEDCGNSLSLLNASKPAASPTQDIEPEIINEEPEQTGLEKTKTSPKLATNQKAEGEPMEQARYYICSSCYSPVPGGHKFCGKCGTSIENAPTKNPAYFGDMQTPGKAKLILIKGEGTDGISYHLNSTEHVAGRKECPILFSEDKWLSPKHATFLYDSENKLKVSDENSENGIFMAVRGSKPIKSGTFFMAGEQIFKVEEVPPYNDDPEEDGTYFFASPRANGTFRLIQILEGGGDGMVVHAKEESIVIGREGCDMNFPNDPYISGSHVKIEQIDGNILLVDMDSKNGTFVKIDKEQQLAHGDYIFMGHQLLRVEITE